MIAEPDVVMVVAEFPLAGRVIQLRPHLNSPLVASLDLKHAIQDLFRVFDSSELAERLGAGKKKIEVRGLAAARVARQLFRTFRMAVPHFHVDRSHNRVGVVGMRFEYGVERRPGLVVSSLPGENQAVEQTGVDIAGMFAQLIAQQL